MKIGQKAVCCMCGGEIFWSGRYWEHKGKVVRHPGKPIETTTNRPINKTPEISDEKPLVNS